MVIQKSSSLSRLRTVAELVHIEILEKWSTFYFLQLIIELFTTHFHQFKKQIPSSFLNNQFGNLEIRIWLTSFTIGKIML
jgi:hypothetical protein